MTTALFCSVHIPSILISMFIHNFINFIRLRIPRCEPPHSAISTLLHLPPVCGNSLQAFSPIFLIVQSHTVQLMPVNICESSCGFAHLHPFAGFIMFYCPFVVGVVLSQLLSSFLKSIALLHLVGVRAHCCFGLVTSKKSQTRTNRLLDSSYILKQDISSNIQVIHQVTQDSNRWSAEFKSLLSCRLRCLRVQTQAL